jgi:predicted enzyme related to lactoylglutathione lyase
MESNPTETDFRVAVPVLPAIDVSESLKWWTEVCGFTESFRDATPPSYAGIRRGGALLHLAGMTDRALAKTVADQTMVRLGVASIDAYLLEFQNRGGALHPNSQGGVTSTPWGSREFGVIDPAGVCVTFVQWA